MRINLLLVVNENTIGPFNKTNKFSSTKLTVWLKTDFGTQVAKDQHYKNSSAVTRLCTPNHV